MTRHSKRKVTKERGRAAAGRHRSEQWSAFLDGEGAALRQCGLPDIVVRDPEHWQDFLEHATLHYHDPGPGFGWSICDLTLDDARALLSFLENYLPYEDRHSLGLYVGLMDRLDMWQGKRDEYVAWCSDACKHLGSKRCEGREDWLQIFTDSYRQHESWPAVFDCSPAMMVASHCIVPWDTPKLSPVQKTILRKKVCEALEYPTRYDLYGNVDYDWQGARMRIDSVLLEFGVQPPWG